MSKLPFRVNEYIVNHFDDPVIHYVSSESKNGRKIFNVSVDETDSIHHMEFNENGALMKSVVEPKYDDDSFEQRINRETDFPF